MGDFFIFLRRFGDDVLETSAESLEQILHFITVFMGNVERYVTLSWLMNDASFFFLKIKKLLLWFLLFCMHNRMKNPHLRAKLAEVLEAVMPHMEPLAPGAAQPVMFQRERVFCSYRHAPQLAEALITVFVDIEFTGEAFLFYFFSNLLYRHTHF